MTSFVTIQRVEDTVDVPCTIVDANWCVIGPLGAERMSSLTHRASGHSAAYFEIGRTAVARAARLCKPKSVKVVIHDRMRVEIPVMAHRIAMRRWINRIGALLALHPDPLMAYQRWHKAKPEVAR